MSDCAFCDIVARAAPATIVREWDDALAIIPLNPVVPGHTLIVPKRHVQTIFTDPDTSAATMRRVAEYDTEDRAYNVITSAGEAATQTVLHLHVHLVPRAHGDGLVLPWTHTTGDCRLFHRWSKWGPQQYGRKLYAGTPIGDFAYQERHCARCGRVQMKDVQCR